MVTPFAGHGCRPERYRLAWYGHDKDKMKSGVQCTYICLKQCNGKLIQCKVVGWLVGWLIGWLEFNVPFQHKYGYYQRRQRNAAWQKTDQ